MDWTALDPVAGDLFAEVLDSWRPDLVHFHSVQRLTGAAVEACARAGIPYLITTHDAWWVSDYQFLIDDEDRLRAAGEAVPLDPPPPATVGDAMARRRYLTALLQGAEEVLAVSRTFADMYRASGFEQTRALPNGVPPLRVAPRAPSTSGRVRLTHVGGRSAHKGYRLLQAALKTSSFANLELTIVDHARYGGVELMELWGATPVRVVGKTPQERMHEFYAEQDVLLAPSIWPESFGLVAREALASGLWVVASDRGAMAEDVVPGVNGWSVDVADPGALLGVLGEIDRDPARFLAPPPPTPLRTSEAQARELLALYDEVLTRPLRRREIQPPSWAGQPDRGHLWPKDLEALRRARMVQRWGGHAELASSSRQRPAAASARDNGGPA
jgi:glycosyltransferase involved in cell wall biosynthesis